MSFKKSPPPRPPLPSRRTTEPATGQQPEEANAQKKFGLFSIRYSRDDANESDEEISIVRKDSLPDGESESITAEVKNENPDVENCHSSSSGTSSILSALTLPFLPKSQTISSGSEALSCDEPSKQDLTKNSEGEIVFSTSHFEEETKSNPGSPNEASMSTSNGRHSTSPPAQKRRENPVISSAMSLSSLLKKEFEQRGNFGKGSSPDDPKEGHHNSHFEVPQKKGVLASVLADSSRLLMPIGLGDFNSDISTSVKEKEDLTYTDVPIYNLLLVSMIVFLYFMLPSTSFMNGFVFGGFLTFFLVCALMWLLTPEMSDEERYKRDVWEHEREMKMLRKKMPSEFLQRGQRYPQTDLEMARRDFIQEYLNISSSNHGQPRNA